MISWLRRTADWLLKAGALIVAVVVFLLPFVLLMLAGLGAMCVMRWLFDR